MPTAGVEKMVCRQCQGIEEFFDEKEAESELSRYRRKGPDKTTRMLIDAVGEGGVEGKTLIDIGGGVGTIQHELLSAGATRAVSVEASRAFTRAAIQVGEEQGHADRIDHRHGNFVDIADDIEPADIVTLDRVICCYHDAESLVDLSSQKARSFYGLVYPRDNPMMRVALRMANLLYWLSRSQFRVFAHRSSLIDSIVRRNGLRPRFYRKTLFWQVAVYSR